MNPSAKSNISEINSESGTVIETGLNNAFKLSGNSVLPAYPGFIVIKNPQLGFNLSSFPSNIKKERF